MAANQQVTRLQFLRRLRKLAKSALYAYGFQDAKLKFINYSGNGLYRVDIPTSLKSDEPFVPGRYTLRLHQPGYMSFEHITSELEWLSALSSEGIEVPQPIRNLDGHWVTATEEENASLRPRNCTLLRWINGRNITKGITPIHFKAIGRTLAAMHKQAQTWKPPRRFTRRHWDWEGLYGDGAGFDPPAQKVRETIPKQHQPDFVRIIERIQDLIDEIGKGRKVYGLIHADIALDANVLFHKGRARPIDFDDSGYGYWAFDIAVPLAHYISDFKDTSPRMKKALLEGYEEIQAFPESQLEYIELFIAARYAQEMVWAQAGALHYPGSADQSNEWLNRAATDLKRHLKTLE
ncbi:MAG: phosphotransferase [Candidatus Thorarchaeota archaeon]|nr:MAG: phosphotransferase [Candidatus Thorarchaeota archaeon]